jgi:hypothetical protein
MATNYSRENYYKKEVVDGQTRLDSLSLNFLNFSPSAVKYRRIKAEDIHRPDKLSSDEYGHPSLWWVILASNDVVDPFNDLDPGSLFSIPTTSEVFQFLRFTKNLNSL